MRKIFFLIPALILAMMVNAEVINISTDSPYTGYVLRKALADANSGDIIEMDEGTYVETGDWLAINDKAVTVRPVEGKEVIIKPQFSVRVKAGDVNQVGKAEFIGVKFDCSALESTELFVPSDNQANQSVVLKNCELYDWSKNNALIHSTSSRKLDVIDIDNCYFHGFEKSIVFVENASLVSLSITNSTFANVAGNTESYDAAPIHVKSTSGSVLVDHCTFYNVKSKSVDYATVRVEAITNPIVSNCIFMLPVSADMCATYLKAGGDVKNCLTFHYDNWQDYGHYASATLTDCFSADPVFKDPENGDYTLRMGSPARGTGLAGSNLGNPSLSAVPEPVETNFASALTLEAADAIHNEYFTLNADHYLKANNPNPPTENYGIATWQIHATQEVALQVTLNNNSASLYGHTYKVEIFDSNDDKKGEVAENGWKDTAEPVTLSGLIHLPAAGDYTVKLSNTCNGSGEAILEGITLSYAGGAAIEVPANTLEVADAIYSDGCKRENGYIKFPTTNGGDDVLTAWAKWNIHVTAEAFYDVALTIKNQYDHNMTISFYEEDGTTLVGTVSEGGNKSSAENTVGHALDLGGIYLKVGNYVAKVTNARSGSDAKIMNVGFTYAGGAVQNMPGTTDLSEAWFSNNGTRTTVIDFPNNDIQNGWVKWHVAFANSSNYKVKVKVNTSSGHNYTVKLYRNETDPDPITFAKGADYSDKGSPVEIEIDPQMVEAGNYILEVINGMQDSNAELISVEFIYAGGGTVDLPATLQPMDAALDQWEVVDGKISGTEGNATTGSAVWNVASNGGKYNLKFNYSSDNGHLMKVEIFEEGESTAKYTWNEPDANHWVTGDFEENLGTYELEDKNYAIKVTNTQSSSHAKITNIVVDYQGGAVIDLPGTLPLVDALLSENAYRNEGNTELHFIDPAEVSHIAAEWAKWNVHVDAEGVYEFTLNVEGSPSLHSIYTLIVDNGASVSKGKSGSAAVTLPPVLLTQGDHVIQIANTNNYADGYLTGVSCAAASSVVILDELDENMDVITANTGSHMPALKRTFRTGVYNSICVPFNVSSNSELERIFGEGYELLEMTSATLAGEVLTLNFATPENNIAYGRPYLIKPTKDVINPVFEAHSISNSTSHLTVEGADADLVGVLYKQDLGNHPENLYLGADGNLYFSNSDVTIKGFRAYFHVKVQNPSQVIRRAQIIAGSQVVTSVDLVKDANNATLKTIENGQLIVIRDGVRYNVMGVKLQ